MKLFSNSNCRFIAEESVATNSALTDKPTWIIDPIDGTNNFILRIPFIAISVAFVWKKEICIGIVYNPILNEFYSSRLGTGSFMNGHRIHCNKVEKLEDATLGHEVSYIRVQKHRERNIKQVVTFASAAQGYVNEPHNFRIDSAKKLINDSLIFSLNIDFGHLVRAAFH